MSVQRTLTPITSTNNDIIVSNKTWICVHTL